ncbi:MAG: hypothetical protein FJZ58_03945 [Chlamydiae bacterium]|nr:hypothetical protein [Chlamydiota bacterium]
MIVNPALSSPVLHSLSEEAPPQRVIFRILQCVAELGTLLSSLRVHSLVSRTSSTELLGRCTSHETNSYLGQAVTSLFKAGVAVLPIGEIYQKGLLALGEAPQALMQGHLNATGSQKNLLSKDVEEGLKNSSLLQQFASSMQEMTLQLVRNSGLSA